LTESADAARNESPTTETDEMSDHAISNAKNWLESIVEDTKALAEARESDKIECGQCEGTGTITGGLSGDGDDEECPVCDGTGEIDREEDEEAIYERIQQGPLSLEVRSDWHTPGDPDGRKPGEFRLLLSTGGPALQLVGEVDEYGEPYGTPRLQWQDWGTPWTDYRTTEEEDSALEDYARCFYYGEG
jgi:hypothetical protein